MNQGDLASYMRNHNIAYLNENEILESARQITKSLKAVHDHGFLHNDIQPCNVYMHRSSHSGKIGKFQVKLSGFAKCQPIDEEQADCLGSSYELE